MPAVLVLISAIKGLTEPAESEEKVARLVNNWLVLPVPEKLSKSRPAVSPEAESKFAIEKDEV